jgi:hypothetical protein
MANKHRVNVRVDMRVNVRLLTLTAAALALSLFSTSGARMQGAGKPIKKEKMLEVLHKNLLPTRIFVEQVRTRGVDFQVTPPVESELKQAGARPELISAARESYRPTSTAVVVSTTVPTNTSRGKAGSSPTVSGPPLTSGEVLTLLQSGVPAARVEKIVEGRGVSFALDPEIARSITAAGGNRSLLGAIGEHFKSAPAVNPAPAAAAAVSYEDLVDQATTALDKEQNEEAIKLLTQAVQMDANKPTAYAFLGWAELYGKGNPGGAEPFMRQAIERGGAAIFRATHDHDGLFTLTNTCKGSLFITKNEVTFKADDGGDTFEASDANIKEVKTNRLVGAQFGAFHLKLGDGKNYNFAPATKRQVEARMIISLIEGFK